jgi:L-rhamnose mutarotase
MIRRGFTMKLHPGMAAEYKKRHKEIWPEMAAMLKAHGAGNYSIFLEEETGVLFGYIELADEALWAQSAQTEVCRRWWDYMADIMEVQEDNAPCTKELMPVFYLA